jgi:hydrogenase/urease accessory protein HupE
VKRRPPLPLLALLAACGDASAHGSIQGIDHFSGGLLHPLVEPTHLISLLALGLLLGQRGIARGEAALFSFAAGAAVGLLCAAFGPSVDTDLPLLAIAALTGLLVALSQALPLVVYAVLAMLFGAGIGVASNPEGFAGTAMVAALAGAGIGANLCLVTVTAIVGLLKKPWWLILVRVVGSWTSASSILVLALWVSGKHMTAPDAVAQPDATVRLDTTR